MQCGHELLCGRIIVDGGDGACLHHGGELGQADHGDDGQNWKVPVRVGCGRELCEIGLAGDSSNHGDD